MVTNGEKGREGGDLGGAVGVLCVDAGKGSGRRRRRGSGGSGARMAGGRGVGGGVNGRERHDALAMACVTAAAIATGEGCDEDCMHGMRAGRCVMWLWTLNQFEKAG